MCFKTRAYEDATSRRWLNDGFATGEQLTPQRPWPIRLTDELRSMVINDAPTAGRPPPRQPSTRRFPPDRFAQGQARRTRAVLTRTGRRECLRIEVSTPQDCL